ncbi:MAG: J domain-containing protein [Nitrospinales bacterium]
MIKRLYAIAHSSLDDLSRRRKKRVDPPFDFEAQASFANEPAENTPEHGLDPLAGYYANLELPPGAGRDEAKRAWKRLLKKYHPDLHSAHPEKRKVATELTGRLNEAYRILDKEFSKKG